MKKPLFAGLLVAAVLGTAFAMPAQASCRDSGRCGVVQKTLAGASRSHHKKAAPHVSRQRYHGKIKTAGRKAQRGAAGTTNVAARGRVVSFIEAMAPGQGVPAWFALRIARVESNYNPTKRGAAGEYGVFQIKCATAKGIGFRGNCSALSDAQTNVQWGLKHLALAINSSNGNLKLAASKHNGGLGRRTQIASYVAKVF